MTLNGVMAVTLRYFTKFGKLALQKTICGGPNLCKSLLYFLVHVQCRRKESSRSLSHLLMSFLLYYDIKLYVAYYRSVNRRYCNYSAGDFEVFRPAGATRFTD